MISETDFFTIKSTPDMIQAGIVYACRSLPYTFDRMGGSLFKRLRRIVAGKAVELAFKRHLNAEEIPHDMLGATPFTDPDTYDIAIGGRRCDIKSYLITSKARVSQIRKQPADLLGACALVPYDQITSDHLHDEDLYIFAFFTALMTSNLSELNKALAAGQPTWMIHPLPQAWSRPASWGPLGQIAVKSDSPQAIKLELGGQDCNKKFISEQKMLPPRQRIIFTADFYTLSYLYTPRPLDGTVGLHCPSLEATQLVEPLDWGNIWVYGMHVVFTGYLPRREFREQATWLPAGSQVFQYASTRTDNLSLPIRELRPLGDLFEQAKDWVQK